MKKYVIIIFLFIFIVGCETNSVLQEKISRQQQTINELNSKVDKMDIRLQKLEEGFNNINVEFTDIKKKSDKSLGEYVNPGIREGN